VVKVSRGWRNGSEINTAVFDPEKIGIKEMEEALKKAQTYIRTLSPSDGD
jgi:hypothetical protein